MRRVLQVGLIAVMACAAAAPGMTARSRNTFLYVHDNGTPNQVWSYELGPTGLLEPLEGPPASTGNGDFNQSGVYGSAACSAKRKLLFTTGANGVSAFRVATDGTLSLVAGSPFAPNAATHGVAVVEIGNKTYVYASDSSPSRTFYLYRVLADGSLAHIPEFQALLPDGPTGLRVVKSLLLFGMRNGETAGCRILRNGDLVPLPGYDLAFSAPSNAVYPDAKGKTFYVPDAATAEVSGFQITAKKAKKLRNSPYSSNVTTATGVASMAVGAGSQVFAFAPPNGGVGDVQAFRRAKNGALTPALASQDSGLASLKGGALDPTGRFLVLVDDVSDQLKSFSVNQATGALTLVDTETAAFGDDDVTGLTFVKP